MPAATAPARAKPSWMSGFEGPRRFFAAVLPARHGERSIFPFEYRSYMGVTFCRGTQKLVPTGEDESWYFDMAPPEPGSYLDLRYQQVQRMLAKVAGVCVRWSGHKVKDGKKGPPRRATQYDVRHTGAEEIQEGDEPIARYLVFIPADDVEKYGGRDNAAKMPSLLDLDPELIPQRKLT